MTGLILRLTLLGREVVTLRIGRDHEPVTREPPPHLPSRHDGQFEIGFTPDFTTRQEPR